MKCDQDKKEERMRNEEEGWREGWREGGREGWMEGGREGGRDGGREGGEKGNIRGKQLTFPPFLVRPLNLTTQFDHSI